ncbi:MAG: TrmO family methyltransferase domain-containing protein [Sciscionella sp.]
MTTFPTHLHILGRIRTPYTDTSACPRQPWHQPAESVIEVDSEYQQATEGLAVGTRLHVLWWAHGANRDLRQRSPTAGAAPLGVLAGRGVDRPNPIGLTLAEVTAIEPGRISVRGMDCVDGTPLLDLKPAIPVRDEHMQ